MCGLENHINVDMGKYNPKKTLDPTQNRVRESVRIECSFILNASRDFRVSCDFRIRRDFRVREGWFNINILFALFILFL